MVESVAVGNLPRELTDAVVRDISAFCIGFVCVSESPSNPKIDLLGSGTLVTAGPKHAIITAHHVVRVLPRTGRLGLLLWSTGHPVTIDAAGVDFLEIARGTVDSVGPDLGAVILSAPIASSIGAQKSFYNLDTRREEMIDTPPQIDNGFWIANGFVEERTIEERSEYLYRKRFFNLSAAGGAEPEPDVAEYDYFMCSVSQESRSDAPRSFGGMSGGGVWQIPLAREKNGSLVHRTPLLSGLVFYQVPTTNTDCGVRCHGRRSVYKNTYDAIRGTH